MVPVYGPSIWCGQWYSHVGSLMVFPAHSSFVSRHVPPSRIKYEEENPKVSVRLTKSVREVLDELREASGISYAGLVKKALTAAADEQMAYRKGWNKAKEEDTPIGHCLGCGKPFYWNLARESDRRVLAELI